MPDAEVVAMGAIADALTDLEEGERARVLRWAADRYGVAVGKGRAAAKSEGGAADDGGVVDEDKGSGGGGGAGFQHFAELYDAASPTTDPERALVASYWVQVIQGKPSFGSQEPNALLKDLGHGNATINKAMSANIEKKPALILQVARGGATQQSRKTYKLTEAGKKWVAERLKG